MNFKEKLSKAISKNNSLLCLGLDTDIEKLPNHLPKTSDAVFDFNRSIIEATFDLVCAYKINSAFYEAMGTKGFEILKSTVEIIPDWIPVILDSKRSDISSTTRMYAKATFDVIGADAVTVNPYFGIEAIEPFVEYKDKFVFVIILSSNPGALDFQYLKCGDKFLFQIVAEKFIEAGFENIGFVVGATRGEDMKLVRELSRKKLFLIPGIGAQSGEIDTAVKYGLNDEKIALINISRAIIYASNSTDFAQRAREKAIEFKEKINKTIQKL
jgi:orotidine-5'-phosphate decarboxylase